MRPLRALIVACAALALPAVNAATASSGAATPADVAARDRIEVLQFESGDPPSFEAIIAGAPFPRLTLTGTLYRPDDRGDGRGPRADRMPVVIIAPGSGGAGPGAHAQAKALAAAGLGALVIDPHQARNVDSTVTDQLQFSFAASTYDVLSAARALATRADVDAERIGALGTSRGGAAVLQAAVQPLARAVLGPGRALRAVAAGWPWCGYQFEQPKTAPTAVRFLVADADDWVSPVQCQAYAQAMRAFNPTVSIRLFEDAAHGFGHPRPRRAVPEAQTAIRAPIIYITDGGLFRDLYTGAPISGADDALLAGLYAPFLGRGATAGSRGDQPQQFLADVLTFFHHTLLR